MKSKTARKEILSALAALLVTRSGRRRPVGWIIMAAVALASTLAAPAAGQPIDEPKTYAGDFWSRPRLTGDWGGFRDELATRGVRLDVDLLLTPQAVVSGGQGHRGQVLGQRRVHAQRRHRQSRPVARRLPAGHRQQRLRR